MTDIIHSNNLDNRLACPCGTGKAYIDCCGIFITNQKKPLTPEALMRSRYTAYHLLNLDYIKQTMKSPAADDFDKDSAQAWAKKINWTQLEVIKSNQICNKGMVEFRAHYYIDGKKKVLHEISEFDLQNDQWFYTNGTQAITKNTTKKIGRNDACPCGSQKKYKKCCAKSI